MAAIDVKVTQLGSMAWISPLQQADAISRRKSVWAEIKNSLVHWVKRRMSQTWRTRFRSHLGKTTDEHGTSGGCSAQKERSSWFK